MRIVGRPATIVTSIIAAVAVTAAAIWYVTQTQEIGTADPTDRELVMVGQRVYKAECASCHGTNLEGQPNWRQRLPDGTLRAPPHDETGHTWHHSDKILFDITKYGGRDRIRAGIKSSMPGFETKLSDREINAVLAYIKSRWPTQVQERQAMINARSR